MKRIIPSWEDEKRMIPTWDDNKTREIFKRYIQYDFSNEDKVWAFYDCTLQSVWDGRWIANVTRYYQKIRMEWYKNFKQSLESAELFLECIDKKNILNKQDFSITEQMLEGQWDVFQAFPIQLQNYLSKKIPNGK